MPKKRSNFISDLLDKAGADRKDNAKLKQQDPKGKFKYDASRGKSPNFMKRKKADESKGPSRAKLGVAKRYR